MSGCPAIPVRGRDRASWNHLMKTLGETMASAVPAVTGIALRENDPFKVLVATIISLRTQDDVTEKASNRLFELAGTPAEVADMDVERIASAIRPANFYPTKAKRIREIARRLVVEFDGRVPADLDVLLTFDGVGRKTANLVLTEGFDAPGVCVDTHVHRIPNRMGLLKTGNPLQTEMCLREVLPPEYWKPINTLLVAFGQRICRPQSPHCSTCPFAGFCERNGVERSR